VSDCKEKRRIGLEKSRGKLENKKIKNDQKTKSKKNGGDTIVELTVVALHTAVFCVLAPHTLYFPFGPVGITLGSFLLYLIGLLLGPRRGCISICLYLCMGFVGLPVFSGYLAGAGVLLGPTGGFLLGYLPCVAITGAVMKETPKGKKGIARFLLAMLAGTGALYLSGVVWFLLVYTKDRSFAEAVSVCVLPFLPADGVKMGLAAALYKPFLRLKYRYINYINN